MWRRAGFLSVVVLAAAVPAASAQIVLKKSIAGVSLGMTRAEVQGVLGAPAAQEPPTPGDSERSAYWTFPGKLRVGFRDDGDSVTFLSTRSRTERTASGVGVGTPRKTLKRKLRGEHCTPQYCLIGTDALGTTNTMFLFGTLHHETKRVTEVWVYTRPSTYRP